MLRKLLKVLGIFFIITVLLAVIAGFAFNSYLSSNKSKILDNLPFMKEGSITFEETSINVFKNFPSATITLNKVMVKDAQFEKHQKAPLQIEKLHALFSIQDLLKKEVQIKSVRLENGTINLLTDSEGYANFKNLIKKQDKTLSDKKTKDDWKKIHLDAHHLDITFQNIEVHITDAIKTTNVHGLIEQLTTNINGDKHNLAGEIDMDLLVDELTFKQANGSFIADSQVSGKFEFELVDSNLVVKPFNLYVNEEIFLFTGDIHLYQTGYSTLSLENRKSRFEKICPLLPENIQFTLLPYYIPTPFYSKTTIRTNFQPGDHPVVNVDFTLNQQDVGVHDILFKNTSLKGRFVNRLFDDNRQFSEGRKRFRVLIDDLTANHENFFLQTDKLLVSAINGQPPTVKVKANVSGNAAEISEWFESEKFFFDAGTFDVIANVNGPLNDLNKIISESDASINLYDFSVVYDPANVSFPFKEMNLRKEVGDAFFTIVNSTFIEDHDLNLDGFLKNLPALLYTLDQEVTSEANITSKKLNWTDFVNLFGEQGFKNKAQRKTEREKKQSMKSTISGVYNNFQPKLSIKIDTLAYFDLLVLEQFSTGLHFENEHKIVLEKTSFLYDNGKVNFSGHLDISDPHRTPFEFELETTNLNLKKLLPPVNHFNIKLLQTLENYPENLNLHIKHQGVLDDEVGLLANSSTGEIEFSIDDGKTLIGKVSYEPDTLGNFDPDKANSFVNTNIELAGNPKVFNNFFKTEAFFFEEGWFTVVFDYTGNLSSMEELFSNGNATFSLENSSVFFKPVGVTFPLTKVNLELFENQADFNFFLQSDSLQEEILFDGTIEPISEMIIGNTGQSLSTIVDISSPRITWTNVLNILAPDRTAGLGTSTDQRETMKASILGIFNAFDPHLHLAVDTFIFSEKLVVQKLTSGVYLQDSANLVLEKTTFDFEDGQVVIDGEFDMDEKLVTPFSSTIQTAEIQLDKLVKSLDYLGLPSLKAMKKLAGRVSMNFDFSGTIDDRAGRLIGTATKGILNFNLKEVVLVGLGPLDAIASRLKMKKRFQEIRFAPIIGQITINGEEIEFPQLEIQSNAIHLFMEGTLSYGDLTNMWVSIPINNLRRTNRWIIPQKTGYAIAKRKVYIEVTSDEAGNNQFKFRLLKRKFYKHRNILPQFKLDRKRDRAIRKAHKRNKKQIEKSSSNTKASLRPIEFEIDS